MTPAQKSAYNLAMTAGYMMQEAMNLCAAGIESLDDKAAASAAASALQIFATYAHHVGHTLDTANLK